MSAVSSGDFELGPRSAQLADPTSPLVATGNLVRRARVSRVLQVLATGAAGLAVFVLVAVVWEVVKQGLGQITWNFLTTSNAVTNGIAAEIVGTVLLVLVGALIAIPIGVLCAILLTEYTDAESRFSKTLRLMLNLLQGMPTIVIGLIVFGLLEAGHGETGIAGSIALALIMIPLIARGSQEVLLTVPVTLRDGADALGVDRWRGVLTVILPTATGGIATASILAIARAAGETAPLLVTTGVFDPGVTLNIFGAGVPNIPVYIFENIDNTDPLGLARAWGAALVLLTMILIANIGARVLLARSKKKKGL